MAGLLDELQRGWGNESFAGERTLLETVAKHAVAASGSILECGPGVSTILLGLLSEKRRVLVFSLENNEEWYRFVSLKFRQLGLRNVRIIYAPLIKYSTFEWYDVSGKLPSDAFDLVVCDGPP